MPHATTNRINIGVSGPGGHGTEGHIKHFDLAGFALRAIYEPNSRTAAQLVANTPHHVFEHESFADLVARPDIPAILITSPDADHPGQFEAAVRAGKHVLIDKPLAVDTAGLEIVQRSLEAARHSGLIISSCHPRRFDPPYLWFKHSLQELRQKFGPLTGINLDFSYHAPVATWKLNRSLLLDHFPHEIDYLRFLLGGNLAFGAKKLEDGFDKYLVVGEFSNGVKFSCSGSRRLKEKIYPETITLHFGRRTVSLNTMTGVFTGIKQPVTIGPMVTLYDLRNASVTSNFADTIHGLAPNYLSLEDLLVNTASAIRLAETGQFQYNGS